MYTRMFDPHWPKKSRRFWDADFLEGTEGHHRSPQERRESRADQEPGRPELLYPTITCLGLSHPSGVLQAAKDAPWTVGSGLSSVQVYLWNTGSAQA